MFDTRKRPMKRLPRETPVKTIWKYTLAPVYKQTIDMPTGFRVRHVGPLSATSASVMGVCVWVEVDTEAAQVPIDWYLSGTGHPLPPDGAIYCGTAVMGDQYVWHVYMVVPIDPNLPWGSRVKGL